MLRIQEFIPCRRVLGWTIWSINEYLDRIALWFNSNNLKLNTSKSKTIVISSVGYDSLSSVNMCDEEIEFVSAVFKLDYMLNSRLSSVDHVN